MIKSICVCGAGTMGSGIAQAAAQAGIATILFDLNESVLDKAKEGVSKSLDSLVQKGKLSEVEQLSVTQHLQFTSDIANCVGDLCIEAIVEKMDAKVGLIKELMRLNAPTTIIASNTSSLSINAIARLVARPEQVAGMHFFNPATIMKLVEIVTGDQTSAGIIEELVVVAKRMGKTPVVCRDSPGFIVNRVARPYYIEALRLVEEGFVSYEMADAVLEAAGFRMGPFRLMDLIGNDVNYAVSCSVFEQLGRPERLRPSALQEEKVKTGALGKKTDKGYYNY